MKSYTLSTYKANNSCVCALGCFDGVHIGHRELINRARKIADSVSLPLLVWSFAEPPKNFFLKNSVPLLTPPEEKRLQMRRLGADIFISVPFDQAIASISPEDFFEDILIKKIKATHIVCGFNYRFGNGGRGDTELLCALCKKHGIGLSVIPPVRMGDITVSSTEIRSALLTGDLTKANALLGRPYSLHSMVIDGQHLGRKLGFPTINQIFPKGKLILKNGVYVTRALFGKTSRYGITNVGLRPTVDGHTLCAETNIFDFEGDLYGKTVTIEFLQFIRPEKKFSSIDELSAQVGLDIEKATHFIANIKTDRS